jgi:hypothetical protein
MDRRTSLGASPVASSRRRSRRARNPIECDASAYSWQWPKATRTYNEALSHFVRVLNELGWREGGNLRFEYRREPPTPTV